MDRTGKYLISVVGPTAVGKTAFSIELAKHLNCEILSADSRQFYKELTIGTAKPDRRELDLIKHHFINSHSIEDHVSAGVFEKTALKVLNNCFEHRDYVVMTGGSGMYCQAVWEGLDEMPKTDSRVRDALNETLKNEGLETLLTELKLHDPHYYETVDKSNPQRVIRALEVCKTAGAPYSSFRTKSSIRATRNFQSIKIGLEVERDQLYTQIDERVDEMIKNGLFEEVRSLFDQRHLNALQTVGYSEIFNFLIGNSDREEAIRLIKRNSRRYAKRQLTWFKKDAEISWLHPDQLDKAIELISEKTD